MVVANVLSYDLPYNTVTHSARLERKGKGDGHVLVQMKARLPADAQSEY